MMMDEHEEKDINDEETELSDDALGDEVAFDDEDEDEDELAAPAEDEDERWE